MRNFLLVALLICLAGCGTIKGIGEDVSAVGGWISKSSDAVQEK